MNNKFLVVFCLLAVFAACGIYAQEADKKDSDNKNLQAEMTLEMPGGEEEGFRGSDGSSKHYLEDCPYKASENSLIYQKKDTEVGENKDSKLTGEPQIGWTITDDNDKTNVKSNASNETTNQCDFTDPGTYKVHNSGSRQLSDAGGASNSNNNNDGKGGTDEETNKVSGIATANQVIPVTVHDVTAPDLWVAFEECIGNEFVASCEDLAKKMEEHIVGDSEKNRAAGEPFVSKDTYQETDGTSYIFVDEGQNGQRNKLPEERTVRYTICGNLFNANGTPTLTGDVIQTKVLDKNDKTQQAVVEGGKENDVFKGVYGRRNVPFITMVRSIDNGDKRKSIGSKEEDGVKFTIKDANGNEVLPDANGGYLFRVPNYPREDYEDQPDYYFEAEAYDVSKNYTKIKAPLYVVNTSASFEGSSNR